MRGTVQVAIELRAIVQEDSRRGRWPGSAELEQQHVAMQCSMNLAMAASDDRAIEVLASGLPLFFGAQLAADITVRCALAADGTAQPGAARVDGAVCRTPPWQVSLGRCCSRNGRKMERGSSPVCDKFGHP